MRSRRAFLWLARRATPYVGVELPGGTYVVSTRDAGVGRAIFVTGTRPEFPALERAVRLLREHGLAPEGSVFLDVGANIGTTTVPALTEHGFGSALVFEPEPRNLALLKANVALNGIDDRVEIVAAALSDAPRRAAFARGPQTRGGRPSGTGSLDRRSDEHVEVDVVTLDEELARRGVAPADVGLLWVDVQGHEGHVLAGGRRLLASHTPVVCALRRRKLARAGGRERLLRSLEGREWIADLREKDPRSRPADELESLVASGPTTDLLVV